MSGEMRIVRDALRWGALLLPVGAVMGFAIRGGEGAASVAAGLLLVLGNSAVAALVVTVVARKNQMMAATAALPSYAIRMALMTLFMALLLQVSFIDKGTFLASICVSVVLTLAIQARTYSRTPWVALTFMNDQRS